MIKGLAIALGLLAAAAVTPAQAITLTWTNVTSVSVDLPLSYGAGIVTYDFLYGSSTDPAGLDTNGSLYRTLCYANCNSFPLIITPVNCGTDPFCSITGSMPVGLYIYNYPKYPFLPPMLGFSVFPYVPFRELISSTVTFTSLDPVPLPAALPLFAAALVGLVVFARRRRRV